MSSQQPLIETQAPVAQYGSGPTSTLAVPSQDSRHRKEMKGLLYMALSALVFSLNGLFVKLGSAYFPALQLVFARSSFQFTFGVLSSLFLSIPVFGPRNLRGWLWLRGLFGSVGLALYYFSLTVLPLADATVLFFTGPMFTSIFAAIFLGEAFGGLDFIASFLCLVGVTLCSKPSFLIGTDILTILDETPDSAWNRFIGSGAALLGAILSALAYVTVRKLGRSVHFLLHVTYFGMASSIFSFAMAYTQNLFVPVGFDQGGFILFMIGITACAGQCLLNLGLQLAPAGPGTLMRNLDVVFAFFYGITVFHEIPDFFSISGATLIVGCAVIMGLRKLLMPRS